MNRREIEIIRCLVAKAADIPPDDIEILVGRSKESVLYMIDDYKGYNFAIGFDYIPSVEEIEEGLEELYLNAKELEEDEES